MSVLSPTHNTSFSARVLDAFPSGSYALTSLLKLVDIVASHDVDTAAVRILCQGRAKPDGADYRVMDAAGKPVPFQVTFHDADRYSLISFRATDTKQRYFVYFANRQAKRAAEEVVAPIFSQLRVLREKNSNLRHARDLLLPQLISGKLDAQFIEEPAFGLGRQQMERIVEGGVGFLHSQVAVEDDKRLPHGIDDGARIVAGRRRLLQLLHIYEREQSAFDPVLGRPVGTNAQRVAATVVTAHGEVTWRDRVDHVLHDNIQLLQALGGDANVGERAADVGGQDVEAAPGPRRHPTDEEIVVDEHDRDVDTAQDVPEVIVQQRQFRVVLLQLLVEGSELLIARLQLFLCSLELFVRRLEFFVARDNLFVRRLQLLVRRLLVLDHRTELSFRRRQLFAELRRVGARAPLALVAGRVSVTCPRRGCLRGLEDDKEVPLTGSEGDGCHLDIDGHRTTVGVEPNVGLRHSGIAAARIANQVGKGDR